MREFKADLHVHTCLSPCADDGMVPREIIKRAKARKLDIVGICDHNSAENVPAMIKAGSRENIAVIGGIEATTSEEVHVLALFSGEKELNEFQALIYRNLSGSNDEAVFGKQLVINEDDEVIGVNDRLLIGATSLSLQQLLEAVSSLGGLAIASHVDREAYSIIGQLGFIPEGLPLDAVEISPASERRLDCKRESGNPELYGLPVVTSSDAHFPGDMGKAFTIFLMEEASVGEMRKALAGEGGITVRLS